MSKYPEDVVVEESRPRVELKGIEANNIFINIKNISDFIYHNRRKKTEKVLKSYEYLSKLFKIDNEGEINILCAILTYFINHDDDWMCFNDLKHEFHDKTNLDLLVESKYIFDLFKRGFIYDNKFFIKKESVNITPSEMKIYINQDFFRSIIKQDKNPLKTLKKKNEKVDILTYLYSFDPKSLAENTDEVTSLIDTLLAEYADNKVIKKIRPYIEGDSSGHINLPSLSCGKLIVLFFVACANNGTIPCKGFIYKCCGRMDRTMQELSDIKNGKSWLCKCGIFDFQKSDNLDSIQVNLSAVSVSELAGISTKSIIASLDGFTAFENKDIVEKDLFYNKSNIKDITRLQEMLREKNYKNVVKRMKEKGYNKGLPIILYGGPGTGKTETVLQLAKQSGRDVLKLNIEDIRSCWVGESEKNMKRVFTLYKDALKTSKIAPILFLNEADAIVSKRTAIGHNSSVDKMENSLQNILLEEIERFEGILIATTNLIDNIDPAFDRRFLFKLKLENPDFDVKKKIWKSKLEELDEETINALSRDYDFSGGQIDNVVKKVNIDNILFGSSPTKDVLEDFCKKEKLREDENSKRVGFSLD